MISGSIVALSVLALALPAFAQVGIDASVNAGGSVTPASTAAKVRTAITASTSAARADRQNGTASSSEQRMQNMESRGDQATANRVDALNKLVARIQGMKNLSDSQKAALAAEIQTSVGDMTNIEAKLQSDATSAALKTDLQTIAPDYRIYLLVMPQVSLLSAADRVNTLVTSLQTIQSKIQARLTGDASLSSNTTISTDLSDMTAKLSDATSMAAAAQAEISGLQPDNGDATVKASNTAALKDARAKIQTAHQDLVTARTDAGDMVKLVTGGKVSGSVSASASASTSAQ